MIRPLGKVLHVTPSKLLVVKIANPKNIPPLGVSITIGKGDRSIGKLIDIIGPITNPYGVVKLISKDLEIEPGTDVFFIVPRPRRRRFIKRRRRR